MSTSTPSTEPSSSLAVPTNAETVTTSRGGITTASSYAIGQNVKLINPWSFATDVVMAATASLPTTQRDTIRWLHRHAAACRLTPAAVADRLLKPDGTAYSGDSVYQLMTGKRMEENANLDLICKAIQAFRTDANATQAHSITGFIETPTTRRIAQICDYCFRKKRVGFIFGPSQIGKTEAINDYRTKNNHGQTVIRRVPTYGYFTEFIDDLCGEFRIPTHIRVSEKKRRLMRCFDSTMLLIIDEVQQFFMRRRSSDLSLAGIEFVREIHDRTKCGLVLVGMTSAKDAITEYPVLKQLWLRRSPSQVITLNDRVPDDDLEKFAAAFNLDPAPKEHSGASATISNLDGTKRKLSYKNTPYRLQSDITLRDGLGAWLKLLDDSRELAEARKETLTWTHVLCQYCVAEAQQQAA